VAALDSDDLTRTDSLGRNSPRPAMPLLMPLHALGLIHDETIYPG